MKFLTVIPSFFRAVYQESKKIVWPTRQETINTTLVGLAASAVAMLVIGIVDFGLTQLVEKVVFGSVK